MHPYSITAIPAFTDNYIWCIHNDEYAVVVDPGDSAPVIEFLKNNDLNLTAILITHHHHDHTGGVVALKELFNSVIVYGPNNPKIAGINNAVTEGDHIKLKSVGVAFDVLEIPGHTLDHIGFVNDHELFCGDTLFSAGCGRMFEGTPEMFFESLQKIAELNDDTHVYCTHEYTLANLKFAQYVDANNQTLTEYHDWATHRRQNKEITLPSDIKTQKLINPFLRTDDDDIRKFLTVHENLVAQDKVAVFAKLRALKDNY